MNLPYHDDSSNLFETLTSNVNVSNSSGAAPPLPPRMESRTEFVHGVPQTQYQQFLQQQFQQQQLQPNSSQMLSPFGTALQKPQQRRSFAVDEMLMTRSMNNDLFIASFSDNDNSGDRQGKDGANYGVDSTNSSGSSPAAQKQQPMKSKQMNAAKINQQKMSKKTSQPDINRFNIAVRNLQKHVVELDQAVSGISKEVEDSKTDLNSFKNGLAGLKKEKERLSDSVSIVAQEATRLKEQVAATLKVCN